VVVGLDLEPGKVSFEVSDLFEEGDQLLDYYSGQLVRVKNGNVAFITPHRYVLLGRK
jgi:hypothetical protein